MATADGNQTIVRLAQPEDFNRVVTLSRRVQDALRAADSAQEMRSLTPDEIGQTMEDERLFVIELETETDRPMGCAFVTQIDHKYYISMPGENRFAISKYPGPYFTLHSIMLDPEYQGENRGFGVQLVNGAMQLVRERYKVGTIFLDCWAGNEKLRKFYRNAGWNFAAVVPEETWEVAGFVKSLADNEQA